jgi:Anti-sigma-K factor rskA
VRCEEARAELLQGEPGDQAMEHLHTCPRCRSERPRLEAMAAGLRDPLLWVEPPEALEADIVELIGRHEAASGQRRRIRLLLPVASVLVAAVAVSGLWLAVQGPNPDWELTMPGVAPGIPDATVSGWRTATGTRVVMTAAGLADAAPGHAYELWFSEGPVHVSAGTFTSMRDPVELTVGVARRDYPRLWVTLEPIDEDPAPSSTVLFDVGS